MYPSSALKVQAEPMLPAWEVAWLRDILNHVIRSKVFQMGPEAACFIFKGTSVYLSPEGEDLVREAAAKCESFVLCWHQSCRETGLGGAGSVPALYPAPAPGISGAPYTHCLVSVSVASGHPIQLLTSLSFQSGTA